VGTILSKYTRITLFWPSRRQLQALCAAHAAAVLAWDTRHPVTELGNPATVEDTLRGLAITIGQGPAAVGLDPSLHRLFNRLWIVVSKLVSCLRVDKCLGRQRCSVPRLHHEILCAIPPPAMQSSSSCVAVWLRVLGAARQGPRLAAVLVAGGYLDAMLGSTIMVSSTIMVAGWKVQDHDWLAAAAVQGSMLLTVVCSDECVPLWSAAPKCAENRAHCTCRGG